MGTTPEELDALGYKPVGKHFPVFLHPETHEEYALARTERKTAAGYHGFEFHTSPDVTIEDDLGRRDLTINAIAKDADGNLVDPFGGVDDIENRVLRHVSDAFAEDPVRILRTAKFAARLHDKGFKIAPETLEMMRAMVDNGEVDALVPERVWNETEAALIGPHCRVFFETLRSCGALRTLFPEIDALFGIPQPEKWHPEIDAGVHTMMVLDQAEKMSDGLDVRFAALVHDLGKASTDKRHLPSHPGHEQRSVRLIRSLAKRFPVPRGCRDLAVIVADYHTHCHRVFDLRSATIVRMLERSDAFRRPERFERFLLACEADARGRAGLEDRDYPQANFLRGALAAASDVDTAEIVADKAGAELGKALSSARTRAVRQYRKNFQVPP